LTLAQRGVHLRRRRPENAPGSPLDDGRVREVTAAIARGDPEAFAVLYEAWFDRAYAMARSLTRRDESFCLDVVQDAMLRAVRCLRAMPDGASLARWMGSVVRSASIDRLRREARRLRREARWGVRVAAGEDAAEAAELEERIAWLRDALAGLPDTERTLLAERFDRGRTLEEAGAAVGLTGNAAHGRIRRALERLRRKAREVFGDGS
jgi:RNA polymerase sigma-70 factor (ECF subfamily)